MKNRLPLTVLVLVVFLTVGVWLGSIFVGEEVEKPEVVPVADKPGIYWAEWEEITKEKGDVSLFNREFGF